MNKQETWDLYRKGKDAWNAWAKEMLAKRKELDRCGKWAVVRNATGISEGENDESRNWVSSATVIFAIDYPDDFPNDLSGLVFPGTIYGSTNPIRKYLDVDFNGSEFWGDAHFSKIEFMNAQFQKAAFFELANFANSSFSHEVNFDGAHFRSEARFAGAKFSDGAHFERARFDDTAIFEGTSFEDRVVFDSAIFKGPADFRAHFNRVRAHFNGSRFANVRFDHVDFERGVEFESAQFSGDANFEQAKFGGPTSFKKARFRKAATFTDIEARAGFSFVDATFTKLPRINGAHFEKLPLLDGMKLKGSAEPGGLLRTIFHKVEDDVPICYRELKNYAIRAGHLRNEQAFFRNELRSRRNREDKFWHPAFWLGIGYELFSDLGKSLSRPVAWWCALTAASAWLYLTPLRSAGATACVAGKGDPVMSALLLALKKGTILGGLDAAGKDGQIYACLYGLAEGYGSAHGVKDFVPAVPDWVAMYGLAQTAFSAALLFLFLLALRNHFRIR